MTATAAHLLSTVERRLGVRSRGDLQSVAVPGPGRASFVLRDPLTLEYFQLTQSEYFLFTELRAPTTLAELKQLFETRFAPQTISFSALQQGINQLFEQGLLASTASGQGKQLLERAARKHRSERWQHLLRMLSFRVAHWDAAKVVDAVYSRLNWIYSPLAGITFLGIIGYALWQLIGHSSAVVAKLPLISELWRPQYLVLWLATIVLVKLLHEFGHAVTCQHFGGKCHEMGVMLLAFFPALYCDVSDVWQMSSKWRRIAVSAAGMLVEVVVAALAFIVWWHTEPGLLNTWLLGLAIICSVNTVVVNANPLLRYDGHYLLADWLEIPNLGSRGQGLLGQKLRNWLLAEPAVVDPLLSARQRRRLGIYAVAARLYSITVLLAIFAVLLALARPIHLENLVYTLAGLTLIGIALPPVWGVWRFVRNPSVRARLRRPRLAVLGLMMAAGATAILLWPIRHTVAGKAVFIPVDGHTIYATVAGELTSAVSPGDAVQAGDVIAELRDPRLELDLARHAGEFAVKQALFQQLNTLRALESRMSLQLPTACADVDDAEKQLAQYEKRVAELEVRAPASGTVIAPPSSEQRQAKDRLPTWSGSPLDDRNRQCWIEPGTVLCTIGDPDNLAALVTVDERDVGAVQLGNAVEILLESAPVRIVSGTVKQVSSRAGRASRPSYVAYPLPRSRGRSAT